MTSAHRKFTRGKKQVETICRDASAFQDGDAYVIRPEIEARSAQEFHYDCFAVPKKPIPTDWPLDIGEAIHNIRSSLDHAVFAAARGRGRTQFPIFEDACEFQVKGRQHIRSVPLPIRTVIEEAQPFKAVIGFPSTDALAVLADLSNADKHREITATSCYVDLPWLSYTDLDVAIEYFIGQGAALSPYEETKVMSFTVRGAKAQEMYVQTEISYEVRIERVRRDRRRIELLPLITTLEIICGRVEAVLEAIETGIPVAPWLLPIVP